MFYLHFCNTGYYLNSKIWKVCRLKKHLMLIFFSVVVSVHNKNYPLCHLGVLGPWHVRPAVWPSPLSTSGTCPSFQQELHAPRTLSPLHPQPRTPSAPHLWEPATQGPHTRGICSICTFLTDRRKCLPVGCWAACCSSLGGCSFRLLLCWDVCLDLTALWTLFTDQLGLEYVSLKTSPACLVTLYK